MAQFCSVTAKLNRLLRELLKNPQKQLTGLNKIPEMVPNSSASVSILLFA